MMLVNKLPKRNIAGGVLWLFALCFILVLVPQTASQAEQPENEEPPKIASSTPQVDGSKLLSDDDYFETTMRSLQVSLANTSRKTRVALDSVNKELKY